MCRLHPSTHEVRILNRVYCSPLVLTAPVGAISLHKCPADAPGASNQSQATEQEIGLLGRLPMPLRAKMEAFHAPRFVRPACTNGVLLRYITFSATYLQRKVFGISAALTDKT
jgi:hypothetical protein